MTLKAAVVGMGYVGIPAAALLADAEGFDVTGIQRRSKRSGWKIDTLNSGKSPIEGDEPGLEELIQRVTQEKRTFRVTDDISVIKDMDIVLIDVQTPTDEDRIPHYNSLKEVSTNIGKYLSNGTLVIIESTVAPGTTENVVLPLLEKNSGLKGGKDFSLAFSYERVMPGKLLEYIVNMPRVIGGIDEKSTKRAVEIYKKIVNKDVHAASSVLTAEVSKTVENAFRDVNIAFANEIALICESMGVNVYELRDYINERDDRNMHIPGAGVGGHCLPKDTWLLSYGLKTYGSHTVEPEMITLARKKNDFMPYHMVELTEGALKEHGKSIKNSKIAILGIAYLENSDDIRNTPATPIIDTLKLKGAETSAHDPHVRPREYEVHQIMRNMEKVLEDADAAIIVTKHREYCELDFARIKELMRTPILVDGRNVYEDDFVEKKGFTYKGIGKGK